VIAIAAGKGFTGRPLMFVVAGAADGCAVTESVDVTPVGPSGATSSSSGSGAGGDAMTGAGGSGGGGGSGGSNGGSSGCGCRVAGSPDRGAGALLVLLGLATFARRRANFRTGPRAVTSSPSERAALSITG
jgi:MYXO-CTERM domain-containing protein